MEVAADGKRASFVGGIDQAVEALGGVGADGQQADVVDLCGYPHRSTYAETATMPSGGSDSLVVGGAKADLFGIVT
ncbi:hypothetical protein ACIBBE_48560, partial [Streptomyces sp. NPDC051644]|uniref:hypothetical protein n=1 Tax=Streptomyces sp. NPDC051644 TaxID=3365666 RepID=UPI00379EA5B6